MIEKESNNVQLQKLVGFQKKKKKGEIEARINRAETIKKRCRRDEDEVCIMLRDQMRTWTVRDGRRKELGVRIR